MQAYFGERDQASAILDSNSEEAWRETKMRPIWRRTYDRELQNENACTAGYVQVALWV